MEARVIRLRYPGICLKCATALPRGVEAWWDPQQKTVTCPPCANGQPPDPFAVPNISASSPGASAQREYERRSARREQQVRKNHPVLGGLILATGTEPNSTSAWSKGAQGERSLGAMLDDLSCVVALHDRRIPRSRANLDHLVVAPSGVWVIDAKHYKGLIERRQTGFLGTDASQLFVGGRNRSNLIEGVRRQIDAVRQVLEDSAVQVTGAVCFIDGDWSLLAHAFTVDGVCVHHRKSLRRALGRDGTLKSSTRLDLAGLLNSKFLPAVREVRGLDHGDHRWPGWLAVRLPCRKGVPTTRCAASSIAKQDWIHRKLIEKADFLPVLPPEKLVNDLLGEFVQ
jgi:hypothetical protein